MKKTMLLLCVMALMSACAPLQISPTVTPTPTQLPTATPELMNTDYFLEVLQDGSNYTNKTYGQNMEVVEVRYEGMSKRYPQNLIIKMRNKSTKSPMECYSVLGTVIYSLIRDNSVDVFPATMKDIFVECYDSGYKLVGRYKVSWEDAVDAAKRNAIDESIIVNAPYTPTPKPASTKTFNQKAADCEKSNVGVRYVITGSKVSSVSITQQNDSGGTDQGDYVIPYCAIFTGFNDGDFLYISAQIDLGSGSITCKIYDGSKVISQATASGKFNIATCSVTK